MEEGEDFAAAVGGAGIFEGLYERMLVISGKTGETDETLETIARQYEREIDQRMSSYIAILEPTLVIILSVIVGMILIIRDSSVDGNYGRTVRRRCIWKDFVERGFFS